MTTRSKGFTLIELLVVVAIIGILGAVGIISYTGYVSSTKKKSAENAMMQLSLAQTEYYSENSVYYGASGTTCTPSTATSDTVEAALVGGTELFSSDVGYNVCVVSNTAKKYFIVSAEQGGGCKITLDGNQIITRQNC